ncbi:MAG: hypothetical protein ACOY94_08665 [Bacillota bacterium]
MSETKRPDPLRGAIWALLAFTLLALLGPAALAALGLESEGLSIIGTVLGGISLLLLPVFYLIGRKSRREAAELLNGDHWAHWRYERAEWERFLRSEWERGLAKMRRWALYLGLAGLAGGLLPGLSDGDLASGLAVGLSMALLFGGLLPGLFLLSSRRGLRRGLEAEPEVYVGANGAFFAGRFVSWSFGLRSVKLSPGSPAVLQFELQGKSGPDGPPTVRIPVPAGCEQEAGMVRDRFREQIRSGSR